MTYTQPYIEPALPMVATTGPWGLLGGLETLIVGQATSAVFDLAQQATYLPIMVPTTCVARRVWWTNGATVSGGVTVEVGIYRDGGYKPGDKLVSGSATQATANVVQFVDITDMTLNPGLWWIAILSSAGSPTTMFQFGGNFAGGDAYRRFQQASLGSLPSTATVAESGGSSPHIYVCGFATTASP